MKREDINIRDPFVLVHDGKYYLYGTRAKTTWSTADGFDCYVSKDPSLEEWEGPVEIFHRPEGFWADRAYWAPECYEIDGLFYLVCTLGAGDRKKGIYVLTSDDPTGPFAVHSGKITPEDWTCIDGTLYRDESGIYLIFSHSLEDPGSVDGDYDMLKLRNDLTAAAGHAPGEAANPADVIKLFAAKDTPWATPVPFAKQEFGIEGDVYFSDGPCVLKADDGKLYMILSSWSGGGYAVGVAVSDSGEVTGPWRQQKELLYPKDGGHGMFFRKPDGSLIFALHAPNDTPNERPVFYPVEIADGVLRMKA